VFINLHPQTPTSHSTPSALLSLLRMTSTTTTEGELASALAAVQVQDWKAAKEAAPGSQGLRYGHEDAAHAAAEPASALASWRSPDAVAAVSERFLDRSTPLVERFRCVFTLRNIATPDAIDALTAGRYHDVDIGITLLSCCQPCVLSRSRSHFIAPTHTHTYIYIHVHTSHTHTHTHTQYTHILSTLSCVPIPRQLAHSFFFSNILMEQALSMSPRIC
jgi:hypothetical protein